MPSGRLAGRRLLSGCMLVFMMPFGMVARVLFMALLAAKIAMADAVTMVAIAAIGDR